ncbi:hypothetical protein [Halomonas sp. 707B3]|uniref:hypothetical protein n=1 Tax=Halomonas sp. 707B3 TaxID=1681043 RepID=UPI00209EF8C8|nr:hypothetical protein [Halomonas sp. 707B3]MCP1317855.1 hypothetical protein [Halomonas sp. 707B3]
MNRHAVLTDDAIDDAALRAVLEAAGIEAQVKPLHLQRAAKVAADIIGEYPEGQREHARDTLVRWMDEALDTADDARLKRITDSIEKLKRDHGELETWRCEGGYIALEVPTAFITSIANAANDARRDIELRTLTGLLLPQLERIAPSILQDVLGAEYASNRGDYERLVAMVCRDLLEHHN